MRATASHQRFCKKICYFEYSSGQGIPPLLSHQRERSSQPFVDLSTKGFKLIRAVLPSWNHTVCTIYSND